MTKRAVFVLTCFLVLGLFSTVNATLTTIGTAAYDSDGSGVINTNESYNLIWDDKANLIWLDYYKAAPWDVLSSWANGLESYLTYNIDSTYDVVWNPTNSWDLPSISNLAGLFSDIKYEGYDNFLTLPSIGSGLFFWSSTQHVGTPSKYWATTQYYPNHRYAKYKTTPYNGIPVRRGQVSIAPVPEPATILLFSFGLLGLVGVSRKIN